VNLYKEEEKAAKSSDLATQTFYMGTKQILGFHLLFLDSSACNTLLVIYL